MPWKTPQLATCPFMTHGELICGRFYFSGLMLLAGRDRCSCLSPPLDNGTRAAWWSRNSIIIDDEGSPARTCFMCHLFPLLISLPGMLGFKRASMTERSVGCGKNCGPHYSPLSPPHAGMPHTGSRGAITGRHQPRDPSAQGSISPRIQQPTDPGMMHG